MFNRSKKLADNVTKNNALLRRLSQKGKIKPFVSERFPLAKAGDAIAHLASRKAMGKVVVTMD